MAAPAMYVLYQSGGTLMTILLGVSSLGGIALSVIVPTLITKKVKKHYEKV